MNSKYHIRNEQTAGYESPRVISRDETLHKQLIYISLYKELILSRKGWII